MCWGRGEGEGAWEPEGVCGCLRSESLFVSLITTETKTIPG